MIARSRVGKLRGRLAVNKTLRGTGRGKANVTRAASGT
jgi:hypothetical protein